MISKSIATFSQPSSRDSCWGKVLSSGRWVEVCYDLSGSKWRSEGRCACLASSTNVIVEWISASCEVSVDIDNSRWSCLTVYLSLDHNVNIDSILLAIDCDSDGIGTLESTWGIGRHVRNVISIKRVSNCTVASRNNKAVCQGERWVGCSLRYWRNGSKQEECYLCIEHIKYYI